MVWVGLTVTALPLLPSDQFISPVQLVALSVVDSPTQIDASKVEILGAEGSGL